jgi:uncharacterized integral membrane protein
MINRLLVVLIFVPIAIVLVALAVANRGAVAFTLDPFNPGNPALTLALPLFVLLFAAFALGMIVGSTATWFRQGRYRKLARQRSLEAQAARERAAREQRAARAAAPALPALGKPSPG